MRLSSADLRLVERASYDLIAPLQQPTLTAWRGTVMRHVKQLCGADGAVCTLFIPGVSLHQSEEYRDMNEEYEPRHRPHARRFRLYERAMEQKVWTRDTLWPDLDYLYSSPYYHEYVVPQRAFDSTGLTVRLLNQGPALLHVHHADPHAPRFGERGLALLRLLRPAFLAGVRAVELDPSFCGRSFIARLENDRRAASVYTGNGALVHQTAQMAACLRDDQDHQLIATVQGVVRDIRRVAFPVQLKRPADDAPVRVSRKVTVFGRALSVTGTLTGENGWGDPLILILVAADPTPDAEQQVAARYQLTPQELVVGRLLANRLTNTEIAERLGISAHTARHHTESVLSKLGITSRREVARYLAPAPH